MRRGEGIIYQGYLACDDFAGYPDFLVRVDLPSNLGAWSYEPLGYQTRAPPQTILPGAIVLLRRDAGKVSGRAPAVSTRRSRHS